MWVTLALAAILTTAPAWAWSQGPARVVPASDVPVVSPEPEPKAVLSGSFWAAGPTTGPDSAGPILGLFVLDASASSTARPVRWKASGPKLALIVASPEKGPAKSMLLAYAPELGTYTFTAIALSLATGNEPAADAASWSFTVSAPKTPEPTPAPVPGPTPGPGPSPGPTPAPPPADAFGLAAFTRATLAGLAWTPESTRPGAITLAAIFTAQSASAATYPSAQALSDATARDCRAALGDASYAAWSTALLRPLRARWVALEAGGRRLTLADWSEIYREISQALREVQ